MEEQTLKTWNPATRVYEDGEWREFYMEYDPRGAGGKGQLKLQLGKDGAPVIYDLKERAKGSECAFDRFGLLTQRTVLAHGNLLSPADMARIKDRGAGVAHCPLSNVYFSNAVFPLRAALATLSRCVLIARGAGDTARDLGA